MGIIILILIASTVLASQAMPQYGIKGQECSEFFMGDECVACSMPDGWEKVEECPPGYKEVQKDPICKPRKTPFCCTIQHSGSSGDCEDVVVNDIEERCAFVDDINQCDLPKGWQRAEKIEHWGRVCPSLEYEWIDSVECVDHISDNKKSDIPLLLGIIALFIILFELRLLIRKTL